MWIRPDRNVPVVSTTASASNSTPIWVTTPVTRLPVSTRSSTACWNSVRLGWVSRRRRMADLYSSRSAWARVARTAGPLLALSVRNWMPASSVAIAIAPPKASTSLTRWPLPIPPMEGLHDIWPSVSMLCVSSSVRRPIRADASAASVPAWPPPTTITSNRSGKIMILQGFRAAAKAAARSALFYATCPSRSTPNGGGSVFHVKRGRPPDCFPFHVKP